MTVKRFKLFQGSCGKKCCLPSFLSNKRCCLLIDRGDDAGAKDRCFLNYLVAGVAHVKRNPSQWCVLYLHIEEILLKCWPCTCSFPVSFRHWKSLDKNCPISFNVYSHENAVIFPLFLSVTRGMNHIM